MRKRYGAACAPGKGCYPTERSPLAVLGVVLVSLGALLLFLCIPGWAWAALLGFALIALGLLLLRLGRKRG